jgi:hypothetical protein
MGWASSYIEQLRQGLAVQFRPRGNSMSPRINSGDLCHVSPCTVADLAVGDVVLCHVGGADYLHLVKAIQRHRVLIGNNRGGTNGWTTRIYGKLTGTE